LLNIQSVQQGLNPGLQIGGVLLTRYDRRLVLSRKAKKSVEQYLQEFGDGALLDTEIRNNIVVAEAPALGQDVLTYAPDSKAAADYATLALEVASKLRKKQ
jgi:chromosome partitioning protein